MTESNTTQRAAPNAPNSPYVITSALKTLHVLQAFAEPPYAFTLADLADRLDMDRNQIYRSLKTLEEAGMIDSNRDGAFHLGQAASMLGTVASRHQSRNIIDVAKPFLDHLSEATQETVHLMITKGDHVVCIDERESPLGIRLASVLGITAPLHAGATAKAVLAHLNPTRIERVLADLDQLPKYTGHTTTHRDDLRHELDLIRERGYALSDGDFDPSARGVGAPIFNVSGEPIGAVSVGGPTFRIDDDRVVQLAQLVIAAARNIGRQYASTGQF